MHSTAATSRLPTSEEESSHITAAKTDTTTGNVDGKTEVSFTSVVHGIQREIDASVIVANL